MNRRASNRVDRAILTFADCGDGQMICELPPTIATPGLYIIVDRKNLQGQIALTRNATRCGCELPRDCPNIRPNSTEPQVFPCDSAKAFREVLDVFVFQGIPDYPSLIFAMRNTMGIPTAGLDSAGLAALECLAETEWDLPTPP